MPTVDVLNVRGTTLTASSLPELEHLLRRGFAPVSGTVAAARAAFGANYDTPAALETYQADALKVLIYSGGAYPARPAGVPGGLVRFIGPVQPTTWLSGDEWVNNA